MTANDLQKCRYCEEIFLPQPGKPGYVDECPACLHERTRPKLSEDFYSRFLAKFPERRASFEETRKLLLDLGIDLDKVYEIIADGLKRAGTHF